MNENEDLISRLRAFGRRPVSPEVAGTHLAAMDEAVHATGARVSAHRMKIVAAFVVGLVAGTSGLATAGALPDGAQEVAHRTFGAVGIKVPHGDRYWGQECTGEAKKNHGQYVRSQPKDKRAEAAASRCGKPVKAGIGDDSAGGGDRTGAGCQGPPPWAGKGKPDEAAKAARKQACGQSKDEKGDEAPGPSTQAEPIVPLTPDPSGAKPSTTEPTVDTTTTTLPPSTATTETTGTTTTTAPPGTTSTTAESDGAPAPSLPVEPPPAGQAS
jgi:hypothetical protein